MGVGGGGGGGEGEGGNKCDYTIIEFSKADLIILRATIELSNGHIKAMSV
jgi:hypothetical protein